MVASFSELFYWLLFYVNKGFCTRCKYSHSRCAIPHFGVLYLPIAMPDGPLENECGYLNLAAFIAFFSLPGGAEKRRRRTASTVNAWPVRVFARERSEYGSEEQSCWALRAEA
ncbi:hypothetical protein CH299_28260 [Rhodococcus sp. 14-2686-1-2]|nr:hypothetical protein CH301_27740 [Rhodococcus sp. 15-1189-1-1a]OZF08072.1 hypothetical protein CH299_28260 [Rhodococcus sp. 14-2686-1-2]